MDHISLIKTIAAHPADTQGRLRTGDLDVPCAFGRSGLTTQKQEGDGATPIGRWLLRELYWRPDRPNPPETGLPSRQISINDGWCDAPDHPDYNRPVKLPFSASHEKLWRDDPLYDLMIPLGYNDDPVVPGQGSAIFFHLARENYQPTEGCVAIAENHMRLLLPLLSARTILEVMLEP